MATLKILTLSQVILALLLIFQGHFARGQGKDKDVKANVSIVLDNVLSIGEGANAPTGTTQVDFVFDNVQKYQKIQSKTIINQVNVLSTTSYSLAVVTEDLTFVGQSISDHLEGSIMTIQAAPYNVAPQQAPHEVSMLPFELYQDSRPTSSKSYNITYFIDPTKGNLIAKQKGRYKRTIRLLLMAK